MTENTVWICPQCKVESGYPRISHTPEVCAKVSALNDAKRIGARFDDLSERTLESLRNGPHWNVRTYNPAMRPLMDAGYVWLRSGKIGLTDEGVQRLQVVEED